MQEELLSMRAQLLQIRKSAGVENGDIMAKRKVKPTQNKSTQFEGLHPDWLTSVQVQQYLGISKRTLQNYRDQGVIAFSKLKGKMYYSRNHVEALVRPQYQASNKTETKTANKQ